MDYLDLTVEEPTVRDVMKAIQIEYEKAHGDVFQVYNTVDSEHYDMLMALVDKLTHAKMCRWIDFSKTQMFKNRPKDSSGHSVNCFTIDTIDKSRIPVDKKNFIILTNVKASCHCRSRICNLEIVKQALADTPLPFRLEVVCVPPPL